ncbi:T9SS type A sorting domain-containing protein [Carboxylicivirga sp. A043]|uniref:chondroitinase family polysaccharide lyase n=1 Tax=Carboxylicivirga litoralis TaxID=2816963 RepID=UPI0021CB9575|nr:chondroitinase family polysaccharide lyase [Carboxylicivirga sp. A043]MCU4157156.1 T9SS type A sorting domain-containing protein [Carboxylicivirga sp. A043]
MKTLVLSCLIIMTCSLQAQDYLGLETKVPDNWSVSNGSLSISAYKYKLGSQSVKWQWQSGSIINIDNPSGMAQACETYKGGMMLWIYNTVAQNNDLTFQYLDNSNTIQYTFTYNLNFTGWRACWIRFDEDMNGPKNNKNITVMKMLAPNIAAGGTLFFDRLMFPSKRVHDRVTPDAQLPYINPDMNSNHWAALWHWYATYTYEETLPASVSAAAAAQLATVRNNIINAIKGSAPSTSRINTIRNSYADLNIQRTANGIIGNAFVSADEQLAANNDIELSDIDGFIYDMAKAWYHKQEAGFDQMFIDLLDWLYDQGLAVGSGMGTNHHYGYQFRNFSKAIFLMKDVLKAEGKLQDAIDMLQYWCGVQEMRQLPKVENFQGIVDNYNTKLPGRLMAVLLPDDSPEVLRDMRSFNSYLSSILMPSVGTMGGLKPDGATFHHGMHYTGYINGGFSGLGDVLNYLNQSTFTPSVEALNYLKQSMLINVWTANERSYVSAISGRHPLNASLSNGAVNALGYLAKTFEPLDEELASQYMRLSSSGETMYKEFLLMGIQPAAPPVGNKTVNYAALNLHRRDNWLVASKGFNKVVTGTEIYTSNNRYGRYQSYGAIQILASGTPVSAASSGFELEGWDWNRFPGTTTIHLPFDLLNYGGANINERSKSEAFAGSCSLNGNGLWAMKLNENDYANYTSDFTANKSVFAFDNRIICLGSNISNSNSTYPTETTLFQTALSSLSESIQINDEQISQFPAERNVNITKASFLHDTKGNVYYLPTGNLYMHKKNQESRNNKNKSVNNGDFATGWLSHGSAPENAEYEYAILVQSSKAEANEFKAQMASEAPAYIVLQKNNIAHIVEDVASNMRGYVVFTANTLLNDDYIKKVAYPCLVMIHKESDAQLNLSFSDPAINISDFSGLTTDEEARPRGIRLTLKGRYAIEESSSENCKVVSTAADETVLEFTCIHGLVQTVKLTKFTANGGDLHSREEDIKLYPNPVSDKLFIDVKEPLDSIFIYNQMAQLVMKKCGPVNAIDVSSLSKGIYFLHLNLLGNKERIVKFVKR